jgi:antitoxin component YwqK of YwqJK toxin-antitoxin module
MTIQKFSSQRQCANRVAFLSQSSTTILEEIEKYPGQKYAILLEDRKIKAFLIYKKLNKSQWQNDIGKDEMIQAAEKNGEDIPNFLIRPNYSIFEIISLHGSDINYKKKIIERVEKNCIFIIELIFGSRSQRQQLEYYTNLGFHFDYLHSWSDMAWKQNESSSSSQDAPLKIKNGKYYYDNGSILYEGSLKNDKFDGRGKYFYKDGNIMYDGNFREDTYFGKGKYFSQNGKLLYDGYFKDNEIKRGKKFYPDGTVMYEGNFKDYEFHGNGKLFHENGRLRYEGNFAKGEYNGEGKVYNSRGKLQQQGYFIKNQRIQNKKTFDVLQNEETYGVNFLKKENTILITNGRNIFGIYIQSFNGLEDEKNKDVVELPSGEGGKFYFYWNDMKKALRNGNNLFYFENDTRKTTLSNSKKEFISRIIFSDKIGTGLKLSKQYKSFFQGTSQTNSESSSHSSSQD